MSANLAVAIINTTIVLSVATITLAGLFMFGSFNGLWSMLMLFFMVGSRRGAK